MKKHKAPEDKKARSLVRPMGYLTALGAVIFIASASSPAQKTERVKRYEAPAQSLEYVRPQKASAVLKKNEKAAYEASVLLIDAITSAVQGDKEANELLQTYMNESVFFYCTPNDMVFIRNINSGHSPLLKRDRISFRVFVAPMKHRPAKGFPMDAEFLFQPKQRALVIPNPRQYTKEWLGVIMLHELRHVNDAIRGLEEAGSEGFYKGEARAHAMEERLLNKMAKGEYDRRIRAIAERLPRAAGFPEHFFHTPAPEAIKNLDALFPPTKSDSETSLRLAQYTFSINTARARLLGLGEHAGATLYKLFYAPTLAAREGGKSTYM